MLLKKELDVTDLSIDIWKTEWTECIDSERQKINNSIPGQEIILQSLRYFLESFFEGQVVQKN